MKSRRCPRVCAFIVVLLAACSDSDGPPGQEPDASSQSELQDPCELLTAAEVEAVVASGIAEAVGSRAAGNRLCVWYDAEGHTVMTLRLDGELALYRSAVERQTSVPVAGVGDEAYLASANMVHVKVGGATFFAQSQRVVADGTISQEVLAATPTQSAIAQAKYEAGYRLAKLVAARL